MISFLANLTKNFRRIKINYFILFKKLPNFSISLSTSNTEVLGPRDSLSNVTHFNGVSLKTLFVIVHHSSHITDLLRRRSTHCLMLQPTSNCHNNNQYEHSFLVAHIHTFVYALKSVQSNAFQTVPNALSSSYEPRARAFEVGSPKYWPERDAPSGRRSTGQTPGAPPVRSSLLSGGGGSTSVPSTTTGPASSTTSSATSNGGASGNKSCPICFDDDIPPAKWNRFNCGHGVCSDCQPGLNANDYKCPICKAPFKKAQGT